MSEYLPQELVIEILLRLPISSILGCTCVCKSWYSLINSPSFISTHLNRNQDDHILVRHCFGNPNKEVYGLFFDNENFDQHSQFDVPFECHNDHFNVEGSCNGLLCLSGDLFYLWNPFIRKSLELPEPIFIFQAYGPFERTDLMGDFYHTLGFGFDSVTNDYKVVRIVHTPFVRTVHGPFVSPNVELYKLSTGAWQDVTPVAPFYEFFPWIPGVYVNGACHWIASKQKPGQFQTARDNNRIVLFDMHVETFREMVLPSSLVHKVRYYGYEIVLFASEGSLCLADSLFGDDRTRIDIWNMKRYGDPGSWVKQFSIHRKITCSAGDGDIFSMLHDEFFPHEPYNASYLMKPMAVRKNGEILFNANGHILVSYDPATKNTKYLGICNTPYEPFGNALYVHTCKVSLILLDKRANYCAGGPCEESSNLPTREPKEFIKAKCKRRLLLGLMDKSKMKAKRLHMIKWKGGWRKKFIKAKCKRRLLVGLMDKSKMKAKRLHMIKRKNTQVSG
ncbi:F-box protein At3g07870-like [Lycium ferocissimum]|uniref:F-box protein At3g07870-like n=1 Tax=Lycium ferocissimum TaxID=112874 RepID=UPI0028166440|nr:F-box protein At3g07870-like [Lycium ferocissimum]